jgi:hypothetical protein
VIEVGEGNAGHFPWIESRTGCVLTRNARVLVAWRNGEILGMLAFDAWTPGSVQFHMAVEKAIAWRRLRPALLDYAFRHAGKQVIVGVVPSHNLRSLRMAQRLGGVQTHRVKDGWDLGDDLIVFELRR